MGFKSKNNQSNICKQFIVRGLIFDSEEDYQILKNIDSNIKQTVKSVNDGIIDLKDVFNNVKTFNVEETNYDTIDGLDVLFRNATELLCYEGTRFVNEYKVGCCFFDKINVIKYSDNENIDDYCCCF